MASVIVLLEQPGVLRLVELEGHFHADLEPWRTLPLDVQFPIAEAARRNEPVWVESLEALQRRYPAVDGMPLGGWRAWACLPFDVPGRVLGALMLSWSRSTAASRPCSSSCPRGSSSPRRRVAGC